LDSLPVLVENLVVRYGLTTAVDSVSFHVRPGEVYGLLGLTVLGRAA